MPPLIIYKGVHIQEDWTSSAEIPGTMYAATENGWMDSITFQHWFDSFILLTANTRGQRDDGSNEHVLLIFDGHSSHISLSIVDKARENDVHLVQLPPHTSHVTQPLDLACFSTWQSRYARIETEWKLLHPHETMSIKNFSMLLRPAWQAALSAENAQSGFRKAGIWPLNADALLDRHRRGQLTPSMAIDRSPSTVRCPSPITPPSASRESSSFAGSFSPPLELRRTPKHLLIANVQELERENEELKASLQEAKKRKLTKYFVFHCLM